MRCPSLDTGSGIPSEGTSHPASKVAHARNSAGRRTGQEPIPALAGDGSGPGFDGCEFPINMVDKVQNLAKEDPCLRLAPRHLAAVSGRPRRARRPGRHGACRVQQQQQAVDSADRERQQRDRRAGHGAARLLPERHARAGDRRCREGLLRSRRSARTSSRRRRSTPARRRSTRCSPTRSTPPSSARTRRSTPSRSPTVRRSASSPGSTSGGAGLVVKPDINERRRPQGQEDRDAAARQHAGRRAARVAEDAGSQRSTRRAAATCRSSRRPTPTRSRSSPPATSTARGCPSRSSRGCSRRAAARCSSTRRRCGRTAQFVTTHLIVATKFLKEHPDVVQDLIEGEDRRHQVHPATARPTRRRSRTTASPRSPASR